MCKYTNENTRIQYKYWFVITGTAIMLLVLLKVTVSLCGFICLPDEGFQEINKMTETEGKLICYRRLVRRLDENKGDEETKKQRKSSSRHSFICCCFVLQAFVAPHPFLQRSRTVECRKWRVVVCNTIKTPPSAPLICSIPFGRSNLDGKIR